MASILFGRKTKSAVEFRTDQAIPEIKFARTTTVDKPVTKPSTKRNFTETIVIDSDDDDATEQFSKRQSKGSTVASGGEGDLTDAHQAEITERLKALSSATGTSKDEPVDLNVASPVAKDELFDKTANELKQKLKKSRSVNSSNTSSQVTQPVVEVDLDDEPIFVAPTVMPGSARVLTAPSRSEVDDLSISRLQQLRGARATTLPGPSSTASSTRAAAGNSSSMKNTDQNKCRLRTRLNGRHTRDWKFGFDENFAKVWLCALMVLFRSDPNVSPCKQLKAEVAAVYGVQPKKLTLEFDGDNLADNDTARGLGMEHDFMIDVKVRYLSGCVVGTDGVTDQLCFDIDRQSAIRGGRASRRQLRPAQQWRRRTFRCKRRGGARIAAGEDQDQAEREA
jgi:hypothetical protein